MSFLNSFWFTLTAFFLQNSSINPKVLYVFIILLAQVRSHDEMKFMILDSILLLTGQIIFIEFILSVSYCYLLIHKNGQTSCCQRKRRGKLHHPTHLLIIPIEHLSENKCILFSRNTFTIPCNTKLKNTIIYQCQLCVHVLGKYRYFPDYVICFLFEVHFILRILQCYVINDL